MLFARVICFLQNKMDFGSIRPFKREKKCMIQKYVINVPMAAPDRYQRLFLLLKISLIEADQR